VSFVGKWLELEIFILSKISQAYKNHMFSYLWNLGEKIKKRVVSVKGGQLVMWKREGEIEGRGRIRK
jgi:hypothetical protein